ncbi:MAG TPA: FAD-dependent oxidoreductase [Mobilitalea sp.]|nr:FAD-dependent oxidoreductase [Mobilitalea sp.]
MTKIVIVGGGWAGCAAAVAATKAGAQVTLLERTDMLLGTGLVGGIMRNNGRFTATEELIAMGGGELFQICDRTARHTNLEFPGHSHASIYDIVRTPAAVVDYLTDIGVEIVYESRVTEAVKEQQTILSVKDQKGREYQGSSFIDATGTAGPMSNCAKYGNGCAMCIIRCPSFGGRVSLTGLTGIKEMIGMKADGSMGAMSGSCKLYKESLSSEIQQELNTKGLAVIQIPEELKEDHMAMKACQQYTLPAFKDNLILLDTGHAKLMTPFYNLDQLRKIRGFEKARYEDPYAGGKGNSMRFLAMAPRDNLLKVTGVDNLFCAGEKVGLMVGHTEAIVTGTLAGYNCVKYALEEKLLELPRQLATGDMIAFVKESMETEEGMSKKYTFSGSVYFERMKQLGLYQMNVDYIRNRVEEIGMTNFFK